MLSPSRVHAEANVFLSRRGCFFVFACFFFVLLFCFWLGIYLFMVLSFPLLFLSQLVCYKVKRELSCSVTFDSQYSKGKTAPGRDVKSCGVGYTRYRGLGSIDRGAVRVIGSTRDRVRKRTHSALALKRKSFVGFSQPRFQKI